MSKDRILSPQVVSNGIAGGSGGASSYYQPAPAGGGGGRNASLNEIWEDLKPKIGTAFLISTKIIYFEEIRSKIIYAKDQ